MKTPEGHSKLLFKIKRLKPVPLKIQNWPQLNLTFDMICDYANPLIQSELVIDKLLVATEVPVQFFCYPF